MNIKSVVTELSKKHTFQTETVNKSEMSFIERRFLNEFPAVTIDDTIVFKGRDVTLKDLESVILQEMCKTEHLP
jgi:hypothetical protein